MLHTNTTSGSEIYNLIYISKLMIIDISETYNYLIEFFVVFLVQSCSSFTRKSKWCDVDSHYIFSVNGYAKCFSVLLAFSDWTFQFLLSHSLLCKEHYSIYNFYYKRRVCSVIKSSVNVEENWKFPVSTIKKKQSTERRRWSMRSVKVSLK